MMSAAIIPWPRAVQPAAVPTAPPADSPAVTALTLERCVRDLEASLQALLDLESLLLAAKRELEHRQPR